MPFGIVLGLFWGSCQRVFGVGLGLLWGCFAVRFGFGVVLGLFQGCFGVVLGLSAPKSQRFLRFAIAMPIADPRNRAISGTRESNAALRFKCAMESR